LNRCGGACEGRPRECEQKSGAVNVAGPQRLRGYEMEQCQFSNNNIAVLSNRLRPDDLSNAIKMLPPFPAAAIEALEILNQPELDIERLIEVSNLDEHIASSVLSTCNSPYFGFVRRLSSLEQAVAYLGAARLREIFLASGLKRVFLDHTRAPSKFTRGLWMHSFGCAIMSQVLAQELELTNDFTLYTAALLHDIGKLVLNQMDRGLCDSVYEYARMRHTPLLEAERTVLGMGHPELGAMLASEWAFPETVTDHIRFHHEPDASTDPSLTSVVNLADFLTNYIGLSLPQMVGLFTPVADTVPKLGFIRDKLDDLIAEFFDHYERAEILMNTE